MRTEFRLHFDFLSAGMGRGVKGRVAGQDEGLHTKRIACHILPRINF